CDAQDATIFQVDDDILLPVAHHRPIPSPAHGGPLKRGFVTGHAILDRRIIQVTDLQDEPDAYPESSKLARRLCPRTILPAPLIYGGKVMAPITIRRPEVRSFPDRQVELLKTFADQAVIAIENTRLFEAEQASKRELQESLVYQTATSEVLNVISRSPTELKPVLDSIAVTAARLCDSVDGQVFRVQGGRLALVARHGTLRQLPNFSGLPLTRGTVTGRAVIDQKTATSEVLGVISRSPNEVQPVLDTIVATARRLCRAERAAIWRLEGETFRAVAHHGQPEEQV